MCNINLFICLLLFAVSWAKSEDGLDLNLKSIFRTPNDFSNVNFDHFEILERNNFDGKSKNANLAESSQDRTPRSNSNAQVLLRIGGEDIHDCNRVVLHYPPSARCKSVHLEPRNLFPQEAVHSFEPQSVHPFFTPPPYSFPGYYYTPDYLSCQHNLAPAEDKTNYPQRTTGQDVINYVQIPRTENIPGTKSPKQQVNNKQVQDVQSPKKSFKKHYDVTLTDESIKKTPKCDKNIYATITHSKLLPSNVAYAEIDLADIPRKTSSNTAEDETDTLLDEEDFSKSYIEDPVLAPCPIIVNQTVRTIPKEIGVNEYPFSYNSIYDCDHDRDPNIPYGQRFARDVDSLFEVVESNHQIHIAPGSENDTPIENLIKEKVFAASTEDNKQTTDSYSVSYRQPLQTCTDAIQSSAATNEEVPITQSCYMNNIGNVQQSALPTVVSNCEPQVQWNAKQSAYDRVASSPISLQNFQSEQYLPQSWNVPYHEISIGLPYCQSESVYTQPWVQDGSIYHCAPVEHVPQQSVIDHNFVQSQTTLTDVHQPSNFAPTLVDTQIAYPQCSQQLPWASYSPQVSSARHNNYGEVSHASNPFVVEDTAHPSYLPQQTSLTNVSPPASLGRHCNYNFQNQIVESDTRNPVTIREEVHSSSVPSCFTDHTNYAHPYQTYSFVLGEKTPSTSSSSLQQQSFASYVPQAPSAKPSTYSHSPNRETVEEIRTNRKPSSDQATQQAAVPAYTNHAQYQSDVNAYQSNVASSTENNQVASPPTFSSFVSPYRTVGNNYFQSREPITSAPHNLNTELVSDKEIVRDCTNYRQSPTMASPNHWANFSPVTEQTQIAYPPCLQQTHGYAPQVPAASYTSNIQAPTTHVSHPSYSALKKQSHSVHTPYSSVPYSSYDIQLPVAANDAPYYLNSDVYQAQTAYTPCSQPQVSLTDNYMQPSAYPVSTMGQIQNYPPYQSVHFVPQVSSVDQSNYGPSQAAVADCASNLAVRETTEVMQHPSLKDISPQITSNHLQADSDETGSPAGLNPKLGDDSQTTYTPCSKTMEDSQVIRQAPSQESSYYASRSPAYVCGEQPVYKISCRSRMNSNAELNELT